MLAPSPGDPRVAVAGDSIGARSSALVDDLPRQASGPGLFDSGGLVDDDELLGVPYRFGEVFRDGADAFLVAIGAGQIGKVNVGIGDSEIESFSKLQRFVLKRFT